MRKLMIIVFVALLAIPACSQSPKTEDQKAFYALGVHLNKQIVRFRPVPRRVEICSAGYVRRGRRQEAGGRTGSEHAETRPAGSGPYG